MNDFQLLALKKCNVFHDLSLKELQGFFFQQRTSIKTYHKDALIAFRGDAYTELWILLTGSLSADITNYKGKKVQIETMHAVSSIAPAILFADDNSLPVQLTALSDASILRIDKAVILTLFQKHSCVLQNFLQDTGDKVVFLAEKIRLLHFKSLREKIAGYLLDLSDRKGSSVFELPYTMEVLSEIFGVARPSLSRSFQELDHENIIKKDGKHICLLDRKRLQSWLDD